MAFKTSKLAFKLSVAVTLATLVGVILSCTFAYFATKNALQESITDHQTEIAALTLDKVDRFMRERQNELQLLAEGQPQSSSSSDFWDSLQIVESSQVGEKFPKASELKTALQGNRLYISDLISSTKDGRPTVVLAMPANNESSLAIGELNWTKIEGILQETKAAYVALYDQSDQLLAENKAAPAASSFLSATAQEVGYLDYSGNNWQLTVRTPTRDALATVGSNTKQLILFLSAVALLTIIITVYLALRLVVGPVVDLTYIADQIAGGDLTKKAEVKSSDEIGQLSSAFNNMTNKIKAYYLSLEGTIKQRTRELNEEKTKIAAEAAKDEAVLQSIGEALVVTNHTGDIILVNKVFRDLVGWKITEAIGKKLPAIVKITTEKGELIPEERYLGRVLTKGEKFYASQADSLYLLTKDKRRFPASISITPIAYGKKILGAVEVFHDITREKEIDRAKSELISLASHQLRTPLSTIKWYTEMLLEGDVGKLQVKQDDYLQKIYQGNQRMIDLVNALLNVSRIELGTLKSAPEPVKIVEIAQSVLGELKPQITAKKLEITESYAEKIPIIKVDPRLTRIIFQNLLANAVKFTPPKGKIHLEISKEKSGLLIGVSDTGCGIPASQQGKVFTKLFRADNAIAKETEGAGLGLYIVKSIVEHARGKIWFKSTENKGTTFYVRLLSTAAPRHPKQPS